jgi:hypothetical protein
MENVKVINKRLLELYGTALDGSPRFRLVWSDSLTEKRFGTFEKFTEGGIFLGREENVVKECKKYEYIKERWILEAYMPEQRTNPEIRAGDSYEPLFVFWKKDRSYLKPAWFAIEYIIQRYLWAMSGEVPRRNEAMDRKEDEEALEKETQDFVDYLESESSNMMNQFRHGEAVLIHRGDES